MRAIAIITTKDGTTHKVIEFENVHRQGSLTQIELSIDQMKMEIERAFFAAKQLKDWQTITLTLERGGS